MTVAVANTRGYSHYTDADDGSQRTVRCGRYESRRTVTRASATYLPAADPIEKVRVPPLVPRAALARAPNGPRRSRMRRCCCTGAPDIGRAHPGGRRGARSFTPGQRPRDCTTATCSPPHPCYPAALGASPAANDRLYVR